MIRDRIRKTLAKTPYFWRFKDTFAPRFPGSATYWNERYRSGGTSGAGSYGALAQFKADFLNEFVANHDVRSVIEFGCGDGAQLVLARYPKYIGLDVSAIAVKTCIAKFSRDPSKSFFLYDGECFVDNQAIFAADLGLSLDVVYHLIEDRIFERYMENLFGAARRFVIIYSSNHDEVIPNTHVRHRRFSDYVAKRFADHSLLEHVERRYPIKVYGDGQRSFADFYIYNKTRFCREAGVSVDLHGEPRV
jgi:hypothetical protein